jgi:hypothetical protein
MPGFIVTAAVVAVGATAIAVTAVAALRRKRCPEDAAWSPTTIAVPVETPNRRSS